MIFNSIMFIYNAHSSALYTFFVDSAFLGANLEVYIHTLMCDIHEHNCGIMLVKSSYIFPVFTMGLYLHNVSE